MTTTFSKNIQQKNMFFTFIPNTYIQQIIFFRQALSKYCTQKHIYIGKAITIMKWNLKYSFIFVVPKYFCLHLTRFNTYSNVVVNVREKMVPVVFFSILGATSILCDDAETVIEQCVPSFYLFFLCGFHIIHKTVKWYTKNRI